MSRMIYVLAFSLLLAGVFVYLLFFSEHYAFLADKPKSCVACHQMDNAYHTWELAGKAKGITCNDCHVDNDSYTTIYASKLQDGLNHGKAWLLDSSTQGQIALQDSVRVQNNCMRCHSEVLEEERLAKLHKRHFSSQPRYVCWHCHKGAGHNNTDIQTKRIKLDTMPKPQWLIEQETQ